MRLDELKREHLLLLVELSRIGGRLDAFEEVGHKLLATLIDFLGFDCGSIHLLDSEYQDISVLAHVGEARVVMPGQVELADNDHEFQQVLRNGQGKLLYRSTMVDGSMVEFSRLLFPLRRENETTGIVLLVAKGRREADESLLKLISVLSSRLGDMIDQAAYINELRKNEREIRRMSKFPRENPNPLFCCTKRGDITYMNQAMLDFLKVNRLPKVRDIKDLFSDEGKTYSHICRSVGEDIISKNREYKVGNRILLGSVSSYRGAEEAFVYLQDITELKTLAQGMAKKNQELTEIKEELEFQTRRALDASRHKSEFLANMSHELRTPLNAIIGFSEVLMDELFGSLNAKQLEYQNDILESGRHLLSLINDILDLSKIEAGKMELEMSEFSVKDLVTASMSLMREKANKHNIDFSIDIDDTITNICADQRKVKQVVFNLLANAMKFTPDKGQVGIRVTRERDDFIKFCIWDSGIGISIDDQKRIFEEFQQADGSLTKRYEGAGLGLAIVQKFVQLHGGKVWVESKLNMGSRFYFTLPLDSPKWMVSAPSLAMK
jgi:signal transduction histidine kinase